MQRCEESYKISVEVNRSSGEGVGKTDIHISADNDALEKLGTFWGDVASQLGPFMMSIPGLSQSNQPTAPPRPAPASPRPAQAKAKEPPWNAPLPRPARRPKKKAR